MLKIKWILVFILFVVLIYTRFINLAWGLPNPMHPDERNMANAIQNLNCEVQSSKFKVQSCFNPHFFAYGQFPLYLGYAGVLFLKFFDGDLGTPLSFAEAAFSLRIISAIASILNALILMKVVKLLIPKQIANIKYQISIFLVFIFSPFFIQFSHFGTTESLLMLFYSIIVYLSLKFSRNEVHSSGFYLLTSIFSGLAIATKVSSVIFLIVPIVLMLDQAKKTIMHRSVAIWYLLTLTLVFSILFSPHNFISFPEFLGSMKYESDVAMGDYRAFYTRQFEGTAPILFQFVKIFPYALGWPALIFFLLGFFLLPYKLEFNLLRLAILAGFLPSAFFYAKWTRFMAPILPLMLVMAVVFLQFLIFNFQFLFKSKFLNFISRFTIYVLSFIMILHGITYLSIYQNPDVRYTASDWIYQNIPDKSYILFETANVVDIPIQSPATPAGRRNPKQNQKPNYQMVSFNFYDIDQNPLLLSQLQEHLTKADYLFIPSRRIFANNYCLENDKSQMTNKQISYKIQIFSDKNWCDYLRKRYPLLNNYYDKLFSGELGFEKVAEFSSYPRVQLFGKTILEFPDESAEETWTVFDHPVIRIYKKI